MSVDIAWETFTTGEDGTVLAEHIRSFIHEKFQQITLPRFINTVHVHSFEFGSVCPEIEIKDVCDPLPDFYEDDDEDEQNDLILNDDVPQPSSTNDFNDIIPNSSNISSAFQNDRNGHSGSSMPQRLSTFESRRSVPAQSEGDARKKLNLSTELNSASFLRSNTAGIPGGTSNMSYFHFPVGGLSGDHTPLAALASGTPLSPGPWNHDPFNPLRRPSHEWRNSSSGLDQTPNLRPRTAGSISSPELGSPVFPASPQSRPAKYPVVEKVSDDLTLENVSDTQAPLMQQSQPSDLQVVARVTYDGDVRMTLTAEILLDYPMPSFVSIPLKLSVTGITFDGVAILAYIKKRMHFCFLNPEDANMLVGDSLASNDESLPTKRADDRSSLGSLLREIHVESEIGRQESGKQVLKNVGKVEKFVLEQVRRIFEDEFVFPSFWTFLV